MNANYDVRKIIPLKGVCRRKLYKIAREHTTEYPKEKYLLAPKIRDPLQIRNPGKLGKMIIKTNRQNCISI